MFQSPAFPALALMACLAATSASAFEVDQDATPDVIFGSGNDNGSFTVDRSNGVELGLRGKLRFNAANLPENTFNSNGDGTYSFDAVSAPGGFGWDPMAGATTPVWNFEFTVNTDFDGSSGLVLADLSYSISLDADPSSCGVDALVFDHITPTADVPCFDHALGDNLTGNGDGASSACPGYPADLGMLNVAQNSWNDFFFATSPPLDTFDPTVDGTYEITLTAYDSNGDVVASVSIQMLIGTGGPCLAIDLRPNNDQNQVNTGANQLVPVAILGSAGFDPCDALTGVDDGTILARAAIPRTTRTRCEDVNGDGFTDMVVYFRARDLDDPSDEECNADDAEFALDGSLNDGKSFAGFDSVTWLGCN